MLTSETERKAGDGARRVGLAPCYRSNARVLVLGSFPGELSLRRGEYYAHPRNLFWRLLGEILGFDAAAPYAARLRALETAGVALWDVLQSCEREGSLDSRIRNPRPNDLAALATRLPRLQRVLLNGRTATTLFERHAPLAWRGNAPQRWSLPSTSPANAAIPPATKRALWRDALQPAGAEQ